MDYMINRLYGLTTPDLANACLQLGVPLRVAPYDLQAIGKPDRFAGRVLPVQFGGTIDVILEACEASEPGDILVVDDGGRTDRSCVGELAVREAVMAGLSGVVVWGCHHDTDKLHLLGIPLFSLGSNPCPPRNRDVRPNNALTRAFVGECNLTNADVAMGDADGVIFLPYDRLAELVTAAEAIHHTDLANVQAMRAGKTLYQQMVAGAAVGE